MNNVTLGNEDFTYYETTGGGQGACPDAPGPSAVHVAMSNTLNTPIEALEIGVPAAGDRVLGAARLGRRGPPPRRRRRRPRAGGARRDAVLAADRAPPPSAARRRGGAPGRAGAEPARCAAAPSPRSSPAKAEGDLRPGRPAADRDPRAAADMARRTAARRGVRASPATRDERPLSNACPLGTFVNSPYNGRTKAVFPALAGFRAAEALRPPGNGTPTPKAGRQFKT